jgi:multiple sugar transport system substrate-binding protein
MGPSGQPDNNEVEGAHMRTAHCSGRKTWKIAALAAASLALTAGLTACASGSGTSAGSPGTSGGSADSAAAIAAALQKPTTLTVWAWTVQSKDIVTAFEKKYPKVKINLVNAGTGTTEYTKLANAIKAGSGAPDIAQIEYYALPQFALSGDLVNLDTFGLGSLQSDFSTAIWDSVDINGSLEGLPQGGGPMALFYNKNVFDKYKLPVPVTWTEYVSDAKKLHAANASEYITNDTGDPGFVTSMIWSAGGHPYQVSGTKNVAINLQDAGSEKFANLWTPMIKDGLVDPVTSFTSQWYQGLANGTIASLVTGGWMPGGLETDVPSGKGDWRVAPMPEWTPGQAADAQNGGSSDAILKSSKNQLAAAGFLEFMDSGPGAQIYANDGGFPVMKSILASSSYLNATPAYFGGQQINRVLAQAAKEVLPGWSYLPFQAYANSIFPDTVGQAYTEKTTLDAGLQAWQEQSASYGTQEGFNVTSK